tara:strand:- start:11957 stop:13300 length:1344 start_codon:yes stop_codon:yes gene_type:complete
MNLPITNDRNVMNPDQVGPGPQAEWQTPRAVLEISVTAHSKAIFNYDGDTSANGYVDWHLTQQVAETQFPLLINCLKQFQEENNAYLNTIGETFEKDLTDYQPSEEWGNDISQACAGHWENSVSRDKYLWDLAKSGYNLFNTVFPIGSKLRNLIDSLPIGSLIDINWFSEIPGYVSNVPWTIMYCEEPKNKEPINAKNFWGLRFRLDFQCYQIENISKALGSVNDSYVGHAYYWKGEGEIVHEADWQKKRMKKLRNHTSLPNNIQTDPRDQILKWLGNPNPNPMPVLYFFCQGSVSQEKQVKLVFGNDPYDTDSVTLRELDLPSNSFINSSLIFCNACESGHHVGVLAQNRLETHFFDRGCAAYIGTIGKTPVILASKFAAAFFHFFYGRVDGKIVSAGEAAVQARQFLWNKYHNIGGLLYMYVNEYELYMANSEELDQLRRLRVAK